MVAPPIEAQWYLSTDVSVLFDGSWISCNEFCGKHSVQLHVITAWNPGSERSGAATNDAQNERLCADIETRGFDALDALGSDPNSDHIERSWAATGLSDQEAIDLGKKYG